jgi:hypothetical protein
MAKYRSEQGLFSYMQSVWGSGNSWMKRNLLMTYERKSRESVLKVKTWESYLTKIMQSCEKILINALKSNWNPVCKRLGKCVTRVKERSVWILHPYSQFYHECGMLNPFLLFLNPVLPCVWWFLTLFFFQPCSTVSAGCLTLFFSQPCSTMSAGMLNPFLLLTLFYHECGMLNPFLLSTLLYHECGTLNPFVLNSVLPWMWDA